MNSIQSGGGRGRDEHTMQLQAQFAGHIAAALSDCARALPHEITERLRFSREQAVVKSREARVAAQVAATPVWLNSASSLALGGPVPVWQRALSVLPLVMLVAGMFLIDHWATREQLLAVADVDAVLLSGDLPPAAFQDPGFVEFLRTPPP